MDPSKDRNLESGIGQVKNQVETLAGKLHIIEGFNAYGSVDLDNLTNFPQVIASQVQGTRVCQV